jgi:hypothetical protein
MDALSPLVIAKALDGLSLRYQAIAQNIANGNTPQHRLRWSSRYSWQIKLSTSCCTGPHWRPSWGRRSRMPPIFCSLSRRRRCGWTQRRRSGFLHHRLTCRSAGSQRASASVAIGSHGWCGSVTWHQPSWSIFAKAGSRARSPPKSCLKPICRWTGASSDECSASPDLIPMLIAPAALRRARSLRRHVRHAQSAVRKSRL